MPTKTATGFVVFRRICEKVEFLLLETSYGIHHWTPPKGHVDPGETEMETAFRETEEESGLVKSDLKIFQHCKKVLNYEVNGSPKIVIYWLAELINPNAQVKLSDEHQNYKWLSIEESVKYVGYKDLQETLTHFNDFIKKEQAY